MRFNFASCRGNPYSVGKLVERCSGCTAGRRMSMLPFLWDRVRTVRGQVAGRWLTGNTAYLVEASKIGRHGWCTEVPQLVQVVMACCLHRQVLSCT